MKQDSFEVAEYPDVFVSFLQSIRQDKELSAAVKAAVLKLIELGNKLGPPTSDVLEDGIFELRPHSSTRQARLLYYFKQDQRKAIIVHCFIKKTQTTPREHIELAKVRRRSLEQPPKSRKRAT